LSSSCRDQDSASISIDGRKSGTVPYISMRDGSMYVRADIAAQALSAVYGNEISFHKKWDKILVMIDPGHGGRDDGTSFNVKADKKTGRAARKIKEKDINMLYALELQKKIESDPRFETRLTRETDSFMSLPYRSYFSSLMGADYFVSIHVNSFGTKLNRECPKSGAEIYSVSDYALDYDALSSAASGREKKNILKNFGINAAESQALGNFIAVRVREQEIPLHGDENLSFADFAVLRRSKVPAVLVETGFLCNKYDREKLESDDYREKMAQAIYLGLLDYAESKGRLPDLLIP